MYIVVLHDTTLVPKKTKTPITNKTGMKNALFYVSYLKDLSNQLRDE